MFYTSVFGTSSTAPTFAKEFGGSSGSASSAHKSRLCDSIRCDYNAVCEVVEDGFPRCTCQFNCSLHHDRSRVCASDLKLYPNECEMRKEACHRQTELRPRPMELCEGVLHPFANPYRSVELHRPSDRELNLVLIFLLDSVWYLDIEVRPCNGDEPVKYPGTDIEINCGNGPTRSSCLQGTFCHRSPSFAKCCRKRECNSSTLIHYTACFRSTASAIII